MAFQIPFKLTRGDFERAGKAGFWLPVANILNRNFQEIELGMRDLGHPNKRVFTFSPSADRTTTSTTFVDWPAGDVFKTPNYTKRRLPTRLIVTMFGSCYITGAAGGLEFAVRVDGAGTDHVLKPSFINGLSEHEDVAGAVEIAGVAAGTHTFTLRARVLSATTTLHCDTNDSLRLIIEEVL